MIEVEVVGACKEWAGRYGTEGYGTLRPTPGAVPVHAHRWVYEREVGPIPPGLELDHLCRNRACVNPDHLEPVTHAENCRRGAKAKLTAQQARAIRAATGRRIVDIAREFGVAPQTVTNIRADRRWVGA